MKPGKPITKATLLKNLQNMIEIGEHESDRNTELYWDGYRNAAKEALQLAERLRPTTLHRKARK